jgi:hypothetical protein
VLKLRRQFLVDVRAASSQALRIGLRMRAR